MGNIDMQEKRLISARMDFVMLNLSFEFHTVFWDFYKQSFMLMLLDRRSVRFLCFPLEKTAFELNFSARGVSF